MSLALARWTGQSVAVDHDAATLRTSILGDLEREPMAVYEVLYDANGLFADRPVSERLAVAERVFTGLVNDGAVSLWRSRWIGPEHPREPVQEGEVGQILRFVVHLGSRGWHPGRLHGAGAWRIAAVMRSSFCIIGCTCALSDERAFCSGVKP
jgi:hypothetical protein